MPDDSTVDRKAEWESVERYAAQQRVDALMYGAALAGFIWLCFDGLLNGISELFRGFLPNYFAIGYSYAVVVGVGASLLHRAVTGESVFVRFHPSEYHRYHKPIPGVVHGCIYYLAFSTNVIFIPKIFYFPITIGWSPWIGVPLTVIIFGVAAWLLHSAHTQVAKWFSVPGDE